MIKDIILRNRSYRRFDERVRISKPLLLEWIDLARISPSSRNQQALKFLPVFEPEKCNMLFQNLAWAGYLKDWPGPEPGERPSAYIIIAGDTTLGTKFDTDLGIVAQSIMLGAVSDGYGGCMIASVGREKVRSDFHLAVNLEILMVLALGKPLEKVVIDPMKDGDIKYWRDDEKVHHVPKRDLSELVL